MGQVLQRTPEVISPFGVIRARPRSLSRARSRASCILLILACPAHPHSALVGLIRPYSIGSYRALLGPIGAYWPRRPYRVYIGYIGYIYIYIYI